MLKRRLVEMSITKALERKIIEVLLDLPRTRKYSTYRNHLNGSKPCIDKIQPDLNNYRDVNAGATWPVFAWWFCLLIFSCIVISGEFITSRLHQIYQNKSNRVVSLTQARPVLLFGPGSCLCSLCLTIPGFLGSMEEWQSGQLCWFKSDQH